MNTFHSLGTIAFDGEPEFTVLIDWTYEEVPVSQIFDAEEMDIADIQARIERYELTYFVLRARAIYKDKKLGEQYLGCCLYENPEDVLIDGTANDLAREAIHEAKEWLSIAL